MDYAIETEGLTKKFFSSKFLKRKQTVALNNINLQVKQSELFVLVGQNGAGKTTLLKILCGLILPTSGNVYINGEDIFNKSAQFRRHIGFVSGEERSFYWRLTGRQNLEFFGRLYGISKKEIEQRTKHVTEILRLDEEINKEFRYFSAGAKQRLALIRVLLHKPSIIFMDEPTRSLDPIAQDKLRDFIRDKLVRGEGKTIFITTHNLNEAVLLASRLAIIERGEIKAYGALSELRRQFGEMSMEKIFHKITLATGDNQQATG